LDHPVLRVHRTSASMMMTAMAQIRLVVVQ
jgi:hypothetical protein